MQTRIIKHTVLDHTWYTVEYTKFLFWHTWKDAYGCDNRYFDLDKAKRTARNLEAKEIKEIVEE